MKTGNVFDNQASEFLKFYQEQLIYYYSFIFKTYRQHLLTPAEFARGTKDKTPVILTAFRNSICYEHLLTDEKH